MEAASLTTTKLATLMTLCFIIRSIFISNISYYGMQVILASYLEILYKKLLTYTGSLTLDRCTLVSTMVKPNSNKLLISGNPQPAYT